jgi:Ala-tRNA(Pro) deacylase
MIEVLGVSPGAVTAFGLINDRAGRLKVVLDEGLLRHETVNCHPLVNTATTSLKSADLVAFMRATGHEPLILALDEGGESQGL